MAGTVLKTHELQHFNIKDCLNIHTYTHTYTNRHYIYINIHIYIYIYKAPKNQYDAYFLKELLLPAL